MPPTASLTPYYRYFALVCVATTLALMAGLIAYETYVGPLAKGIEYGLWVVQIMLPSSLTASRFVQAHRRSPTDEEKKKLSRVSFGLTIIVGVLPSLAIAGWFYAMAFVVADPAYQLYYYVYRQQAVSMFTSLGLGFWILIVGLLVFTLSASYLMIRGQYGRMAEKMAARLSPP
ncbi:ABZJ_00895 family protein [Ensifer sp. 4252]|uniref:ABZJ_00895 family protein n=1 Tax=Ensifer sp. 4252 TaxID=3373915 RepID=UPI003D1BDF85